MYQSYFGLREAPFGITPDTGFFFASGTYQEALNTLLLSVENGEGFIKITGEVGTGKTLLCRKFLSALSDVRLAPLEAGGPSRPRYVTAYIPNPALDPRTLLMALADELQLNLPRDIDAHRLNKALTRCLLDHARAGRGVVLCLDEAQAMPLESLETVRLLTNLETEKRKLLQVVLFGQPELDQRLADESVRQIRQRITFDYRMSPLRPADLDYYLAHRLAVAGYAGGRLFSTGAVKALYRVSGGVPRLVNVLAHKALMLAFGQGVKEVSAAQVRAAASDTPASRMQPARWWWFALPALALVVALLLPGSPWA